MMNVSIIHNTAFANWTTIFRLQFGEKGAEIQPKNQQKEFRDSGPSFSSHQLSFFFLIGQCQ